MRRTFSWRCFFVILFCNHCLVLILIILSLSSLLHLSQVENLRITEQPTLMEAPTPSHMAEEWYLRSDYQVTWLTWIILNLINYSHGHSGVYSVLSGDSAAKGRHVAPHVESWVRYVWHDLHRHCFSMAILPWVIIVSSFWQSSCAAGWRHLWDQ